MPPSSKDAIGTTVFVARSIYTMEPDHPIARAVAVADGLIGPVGTLDSVVSELGETSYTIDDRFGDHVLLPGLIDQHLHPLLGATTLTTEVIAPEDWNLPDRFFPATSTPDTYDERLADAVHRHDPAEPMLMSWGYHSLWHGDMDRTRLDRLAPTTPVGIWQRSCHELYLNTAALQLLGLAEEDCAGHGPDSDRLDFEAGHFWEGGFFNIVLPHVAPYLVSPDRLSRGLVQLVRYLHQSGVTAINEPGIIWAIEPWELYQQILGAEATPFSSTFLVDARSQAAAGIGPADVVADAERQIEPHRDGKVRLVPKQVKMFADGAVISQLMQMNEPYLDPDGQPDPAHQGEWLMEPDLYAAYFRAYWDAGWQIHTHVSGDRGLDMILDTLETAMAESPRQDHRSVMVHLAVSTEEQVDRIARLGAIVSANPYYPCGFADKFSDFGLGPERADSMVRSASVLKRSIPLSFHSDLPMAPAEPLSLAGFGVNRLTQSGRVAAPEQRISVHDALRAVTIEAAYSWQAEESIGSIAPGKVANFTVLADDPYEIGPDGFDSIPVVATIFDGDVFPVAQAGRADRLASGADAGSRAISISSASAGHGCCCEVAHALAAHIPTVRAS